VTGFDPAHAPATQTSVRVQAFPSLQLAPSALGGFEQRPVAGLHVPATWHWSAATQVTGFVPVQVPLWHESVWVQALPSLHAVPFATGAGLEHTPVAGPHVPATWHWSAPAQVTGFVPVQVPLWHESVWVQALPSLHAVPFATGVCVHAVPLHASVVHGFPSSQDGGQPPPRNANPSWQVTVEPEFMFTCAAASAPTNFDVCTVTSAFVATKSAWTWASRSRSMSEHELK
jgi:hypothetical protein